MCFKAVGSMDRTFDGVEDVPHQATKTSLLGSATTTTRIWRKTASHTFEEVVELALGTFDIVDEGPPWPTLAHFR